MNTRTDLNGKKFTDDDIESWTAEDESDEGCRSRGGA